MDLTQFSVGNSVGNESAIYLDFSSGLCIAKKGAKEGLFTNKIVNFVFSQDLVILSDKLFQSFWKNFHRKIEWQSLIEWYPGRSPKNTMACHYKRENTVFNLNVQFCDWYWVPWESFAFAHQCLVAHLTWKIEKLKKRHFLW